MRDGIAEIVSDTGDDSSEHSLPVNRPSNNPLPSEEFVHLFSRHQRKIYLYVLSQVPNPVDAEEILQDTNVIIWSKYQQFRPGTNFSAWACQIANYEVLKYRDKRRRDRLLFSDEFVRQVAADAMEHADALDSRRQALLRCLGKLQQDDRELIQRRYAPGESGKSVAESLERPVNSVYQSLGRIRRTLLDCITRRLAAETGQ